MNNSAKVKVLEVDQELIFTSNENSIRVIVSNLGKKQGKKFTCKKTPEGLIVRRVA